LNSKKRTMRTCPSSIAEEVKREKGGAKKRGF